MGAHDVRFQEIRLFKLITFKSILSYRKRMLQILAHLTHKKACAYKQRFTVVFNSMLIARELVLSFYFFNFFTQI